MFVTNTLYGSIRERCNTV